MNPSTSFDSSSFFRRAIFAALLIGIFLLHTVFSFEGLTHKTGIDQAQVAREVAKGNGFTTQFVRPLSIQQLIENDKPVNIEHMPESYHSPLNMLVYAGVLKRSGAEAPDSYQMGDNDKFFALDQAIAITCAVFFLIAIGVNYLMISRIFDQKIASVVALIMLLSNYMWQITQSGLPQMLMLTLFSTAAYMAWRAVEAQESDKSPLIPAILSGFFFGLLALSHWITLWIFIGYFIFAVFYFKPRGIIGISLLALMILFIAGPVIYYLKQTGEPLGTAFHAIHKSESCMRDLTTPAPMVKGILSATGQSILQQFSTIHSYLGGLVLAPAFFIALAHPFKRSCIAIFRWNILIMWVFASAGMAIYGISDKVTDPNQLHILFAPLMCAYGIAMISIIWSRCALSKTPGIVGNMHLAVIILVVATPTILFIKQLSNDKATNRSINGVHALSLNKTLKSATDERDIIISDQPWAVAWYADRHAIWMPTSVAEITALEALSAETNPISGIHVSSMSYREQDMRASWIWNREMTPLLYAQWMSFFTRENVTFEKNSSLASLVHPLTGRYNQQIPLSGLLEPSIYYTRTTAKGEIDSL